MMNVMKNFELVFLGINFLLDVEWRIDFHCQNNVFYNAATTWLVRGILELQNNTTFMRINFFIQKI